MPKKIFIGTSNQGKIREFKQGLKSLNLDIITNLDLKINFDPEEIGDNYLEIAKAKAKAWSEKSQLPTLADDSGLSIDFLGGKPGIFSKRFFNGSDQDRNQYILKLLSKAKDNQRQAHFYCALVFYDPNLDKFWHCISTVSGHIDYKISGDQGFGYDPIFIPDGYSKSFANMPKIKQKLSHRAKAIVQILPILRQWI